MPIGKGTNGDDRRGSTTVKRETFRPPWVKEGPDDLRPKPSDFLTKSKQMSKDAAAQKAEAAKKVSETAENGAPFVRPQLKPVPPKDPAKLQSKEVKVPIKLNSTADRSMNYPEPKPSLQQNEDQHLDKTVQQRNHPIPRQDSLKKVVPPIAPPMPPPAPKFPKASDLKGLTDKQKAAIESLKARPKVRPDWTAMLKEVESGPKLKHVQCNDRSQPLLPEVKDSDKSQFIYESERTEKDNSHNQLLKEIQGGVSLKKVKTNDRSKPILEGLRKFRRQMTIEEQIIKSQSMASIPPEEIADEADELDDIDKVRDDLQSTKQMLAIELRNKESLARENKRLQTRLAQLESELDKEITNKKVVEPAENDDKMLTSLKCEAADARKTAEDLQQKYHEASNQLDNTKSELEEVRKQKQLLEKKLHETLSGKRISISERQDSIRKDSESEPEEVHDSDGDDEDDDKKERKLQKEVKQLRNKLRGYKTKEDNAKKERIALKTQGKRLQQAIKDERRKYHGLKKEVHKMAALLKDPDDSDEGEEEDEEEEETQSESESETSESETESEGEKSFSEAEDAPVEKKRTNLTKRTKGYEGRLTALKKANYMLKTNVERLQDDLNKQKEESSSLQQELDSVLAELG